MIPYAEYVIMDRAIPRVEDGLKPVQRRVLYTMYELDITPDKPTKKSARIVGDCLGKFHPHGDTSVYGALVRLAQDFSIRNCLVEGQGNFGSIDGDGAAAMRYTEARLSPLALELLKDIDKDTVDFTNNFDDTMVEPVTIPGRFPNLLVNGAYGIAVGLATNIPTHNLSETIDGTILRIRKPKSTLAEVMNCIKGPDFPSGGYLIKSDLVQAYETGRGRIFIRAKCNIDEEKGKEMIIISQLPYQVNKASLQQKIISLRENKESILQGIVDVTDESDVNEIRVIIRIKKDYSAKEILEELYKKTDLSISFNINMVAIADGKPKQMSLLEILDAYVKYQIKVILRRSKYEYNEAKKREHILEALCIAVRNIDEVVEIIKTSKNTSEAKSRLMERFSLDGEQAQAILDLRLARLTSLEVFKLEQELSELKILIAKLYEIIHSEEKQKQVLITELLEIKKKYGDERRTIILDSVEEVKISAPKDREEEDCVVFLNARGEIKRVTTGDYSKFASPLKQTSELCDVIIKKLDVKSLSTITLFTNLGNMYQFVAESLPYSKIKEKNTPNLVVTNNFLDNEKIINIFSFNVSEEGKSDKDLIFFTSLGSIKRTNVSEYILSRKDSCLAIKLKEGDYLQNVDYFVEGLDIFFAATSGMCLRCFSNDVPLQGRMSMGVKGMVLNEKDTIVYSSQIDKAGEIVAISSNGFAKRVILGQIPTTARARKGVKLFDLKDKKTYLAAASYVTEPYNIVIVGDTSDINVITSEEVKIDKRESKGKQIQNLKFFERIDYAKKILN